MIKELKTADDWWNNFAEIKDDIKGYTGDPTVAYLIGNEQFCKWAGEELIAYMTALEPCNYYDLIDKLEEEGNPLLAQLLNTIWLDAPDTPSIHSWPNWHNFCDLCSEMHVLEPDVT